MSSIDYDVAAMASLRPSQRGSSNSDTLVGQQALEPSAGLSAAAIGSLGVNFGSCPSDRDAEAIAEAASRPSAKLAP